MADQPTLPPPRPEHLSSSLRRNIEVLQERRRQEAASSTPQERLAAAITAFTGSMPFVYLHLALYGAWIAINVGLIPGLRARSILRDPGHGGLGRGDLSVHLRPDQPKSDRRRGG